MSGTGANGKEGGESYDGGQLKREREADAKTGVAHLHHSKS